MNSSDIKEDAKIMKEISMKNTSTEQSEYCIEEMSELCIAIEDQETIHDIKLEVADVYNALDIYCDLTGYIAVIWDNNIEVKVEKAAFKLIKEFQKAKRGEDNKKDVEEKIAEMYNTLRIFRQRILLDDIELGELQEYKRAITYRKNYKR